MKKLIQFELRKIFSKRLTQVSLLALLLLSFLLDFSSYQNMYAFNGKSREGTGRTAVEIDKSIAEKYEGMLTDEKVQQMMAEFKPTQDLHGMNAVYLYQNALQSALFRNFSDLNGNWNGLSVSDVFGNEEIKIGYTYGWLTTSQNMVKIFLVLSLVAAIMTAPVFSGEYGGVDNIILTSKYGKTKCAAAKIMGSILAALIVTATTLAINLIYAFILYGSDGLDCSILFAPVVFATDYIPFNITCGTLLEYQILLAFTGTISITGITLVLSALCKNQTVALVASAAIYLFPVMLPVTETSSLFKIITLLPLYHAQFVSLMSVKQINGNILYALMAVPVALIFMGIGVFISRSFFAKHEVS
ncbi:MAG: ABC transporter permease [Candidatus Gastranaerophilales bacterium]|nr:ABC transporter permease [Candidatus Gastranaerophilales bacterium]